MKLRLSSDFVVESDVEPWSREGLRVGMLGGPGSGKSWNNSLIAEQFLQQGGTVVIFQPRDEYFTLKEKFDILSVGGVHAKDMEFGLTSPSIYAKAVVEDGISMIFYTSAVDDEEKLIDWVARFIAQILRLEEKHKRPLLLILEEAQEYTPKSPSGHVAPPWVYNRMIKAFKDCFSQGRKLNIIAVASSQRPQELNFTVRQLANLTFYGKFSDQDIGYIDKECLTYVRKRGVEVDASQLMELKKGQWLVIMGRETRFVQVTHPRLTHHGAETPRLEYVAPRASETRKTIDDLTKSITLALEKEQSETSELEKSKRKIRELEAKQHQLEEKANIKVSVREMLSHDTGKSQDPAPADSALVASEKAELEEFRSGRKIATSVEKKLQELTVQEATRCDQLEQAHKDLKKYLKFSEALAEIMPTQLPTAIPTDGSALVVTETTPEIHHKISKPIVETDDSSYEGRLISLAIHDFFDEKRRLAAIAKEITRVYGVQTNNKTTSAALEGLIQKKILQREEASGGGWEYWLFPGAKERIKEAS